VGADDLWARQRRVLGQFIRTQRQLADMSLRELSQLTSVSNPYLSQIERGLHEPSVRVLKSIANALNISAETLLAEAGLLDDEVEETRSSPDTVAAIKADPALTAEQKQALLAVYRSYLEAAREA
jgi:transcriptional regulator with XRE-family HTH domain